MYRGLFLDRDGVINRDYGYVHEIAKFHFIPGIFDLVCSANALNFKVIVITNQSGIGRGYYSLSEFNKLSDWMKTQFKQRCGQIDDIYFCPYHPTEAVGEFKRWSYNRKPAPGMIMQASIDHKIDLKKSFLVGDKKSDMVAGHLAGITNLFLLSDEIDDRYHVKSLEEVKLALFETI